MAYDPSNKFKSYGMGFPSNMTKASIIPYDTTNAALQEAHDYCLANGTFLDLAGQTYTITDGVTFRTAAVGIYGNGATLDATNMTGLYAVKCDSLTADQPFGAKEYFIDALRINGPSVASATGIKGLWINGTNGSRSPRPTLRNVHLDGFGIAVDLGDFAYLTQFESCESRGAGIGIRQSVGNDSGENTTWTGGGIYNHSEVAVQTLDESSEFNFSGVSFDYGPKMFDLRAGRVNCFGGHFENSGAGWADDAFYLTGDGTSMNIFGGYLVSATSQPTALAQLINVADVRAALYSDGLTIQNWGNTANKMATGPGRCDFRNTKFYANGINVNPTRITDTYSKLVDGSFEAASFPRDYWSIITDSGGVPTNRTTGANGTLATSATVASVGSRSLRINKTGAGAFTFIIIVPVGNSVGPFTGRFQHTAVAGTPLTGAATTWDAGFGVFNGNDSNGIPYTPLLTQTATNTFTPTVGTWNTVNLRTAINVPAWAGFSYVRFTLPSAQTGDFYIDDFSLTQW